MKITSSERCKECGRPYNNDYNGWCQNCNSKHLERNFIHSGNDAIDELLKEVQKKAKSPYDVMEWIEYHRLKGKKHIAKGGFGIVQSAIWLDGPIDRWNNCGKKWKRYKHRPVALKILKEKTDLPKLLKEVESYFSIEDKTFFIRFMGLSKDPEGGYIIVMELAHKGSLRKYLKTNFSSIAWMEKIAALLDISMGLDHLHASGENLTHRDLHPGNLLYGTGKTLLITDLGLCESAAEKSSGSGDLPYVAPEVLRKEEYKKAADVYSFGMVAYEIATGFPPYFDAPHDVSLSLCILGGLRPEIPSYVPEMVAKLIEECWDENPDNRPTSEKLHRQTKRWYNFMLDNKKNEFTEQINRADKEKEKWKDGKLPPKTVYKQCECEDIRKDQTSISDDSLESFDLSTI